jgi:hypothetical protein
MLLKGRLVRNQHTARMSLIIPTFYDARDYAEYCLTTTEAVHLSANYTVQDASTQSKSIPFHGVITGSSHKSFSNTLAINKHYFVTKDGTVI